MGEGRQAQFKVKLEEQVAALRQQVNSGEMKQMPQQVQLKQNSPQRATQDKPPQARQSVKVRLEQIKAKQGTQARQPDRTNHTPSRPKLK